MIAEPGLEELSSYLDQQLPEDRRRELEVHLHDCETCRRRLDALRLAVNAVRALPMESPPRAFTLPVRRAPAARWAPLAWAGGVGAAALLVVTAGYVALQHPSGGGARYAGGAAAPRGETAFSQAQRDTARAAQSQLVPTALRNTTSVSDPRAASRQLTLSTDAVSYPADGVLVIRVTLQGAQYPTASPLTLSTGGVRLTLLRDGYAVELPAPYRVTSSPGPTIEASYRISDLPLADPKGGRYRLIATWQLPDPPGAALVAEVPLILS